VWLADVSIQRFEVEVELAEMLGLKSVDLQLDGDEAIQPAVKEQKVQRKVAAAYWIGNSEPM